MSIHWAGLSSPRSLKHRLRDGSSHDADPGELAVIFLTGLFALLVIGATASPERATLLDRYVMTIVRGMEER